ncbi:kinesin-like protein KIN-7O isoform X1 [Olea europaea var. sylvestris]|uniref:kinesin-like protein KIN-7O isoform X1 n=1 Tax=Olea europaea var. sylvestris TaxID=158386 RepID=UPI000C1CD790|nr:kinesin-like protein KIN-7O isoform X1 [Olea europaea var. sylvestris]
MLFRRNKAGGGLQEAGSLASDLKELEEQLSIAHGDKDVATLRSESLASDLKELSDELNDTKSKLSTLKEEVSALSTTLDESELQRQKVESSLTSLIEEKEELSMVLKMNSAVFQIPIAFVWIPGFYPLFFWLQQLAEALLTMEEEKALWSSKEKATVKAFEEEAKAYHFEIALLSKELSKVIFQNYVDYLLNII